MRTIKGRLLSKTLLLIRLSSVARSLARELRVFDVRLMETLIHNSFNQKIKKAFTFTFSWQTLDGKGSFLPSISDLPSFESAQTFPEQ
jgi:hypothetical protein